MAWLAFMTVKSAIRFPYTQHIVCCTYSIILQNKKQKPQPTEQPQKTVTPFHSVRSWCWKVLQRQYVLFYNKLDRQYQMLDFVEKITDLFQPLNRMPRKPPVTRNTVLFAGVPPKLWFSWITYVTGWVLTFQQGNNTCLTSYSVTRCKAQ